MRNRSKEGRQIAVSLHPNGGIQFARSVKVKMIGFKISLCGRLISGWGIREWQALTAGGTSALHYEDVLDAHSTGAGRPCRSQGGWRMVAGGWRTVTGH